MKELLIYCSHALMISAIVVGVLRFSALPPMARLIFFSLPCAVVAETIGRLREEIQLDPELFYNVYAVVEGSLFISGALLLLQRPLARGAAWAGVAALAAVVIYQHFLLRTEGFNMVVFLTQSVIIVALYLLALAEAVLTENSAPVPTGVLTLCVAVLVYYSLAPLSFPTTSYFYFKGKIKLAEQASVINNCSSVLRYGLTLVAYIILSKQRRQPPALAYE